DFKSDQIALHDAPVERQSFFPLAAWPASKKVFGYFPTPQILNEPKSLYQSPSGASGFDSLHALSWYRSSAVILRSRSRSKRWSRSAGGKPLHRILGTTHRRS